MKNKTIYILVGKKGSGKSHIGNLIEKSFKVKYFRVEEIALKIKGARQVNDNTYIVEYFNTIESEVRKLLLTHDKIVFESTGLTSLFDQMVKSLRNDFQLVTIRINASDNTCLKRVKSRNQSIHVNVSDDQLQLINKQVNMKDMFTNYSFNNENKSDKEIIYELKSIFS